ncbi:MAG: adenylyltransferase/cytidyltransferase family protein [Deltaproteobacteria bacterium]|nr:adenylyltransferase/cytidyltransferase family protein [Deltaproteobacteria bacterium]
MGQETKKRGCSPRKARDKILSAQEAANRLRSARRRGERVVFTNGCFDLMHVGHVRSLEEARSFGDQLVVAVNSDASVRSLDKGSERPFVPARQRAELIASLECVDVVIIFGASTPLSLIKKIQPDVLAKGGDWSLENIVGAREVIGWGGQVKRLREIAGVRTTLLAQKVKASR